MRHIGNLTAAAALLALGMAAGIEPERVTAAPIKPRRNYDLQGPEPKAGPPQAKDAEFPMTRQQRRWQERQSAKRR